MISSQKLCLALFFCLFEKVKTIADWIPVTTYTYKTDMGKDITVKETVKDIVQRGLDVEKLDPKQKTYWEQPTLGSTNISLPKIEIPDITLPELKLPDFGGIMDTLKWVLIGGAMLVGLYLISGIVRGGKK